MKELPRWIDRVAGSGGVIAYHGVGPQPFQPVMHVAAETMRPQLEFLRSRYQIVPLMELLARWQQGASTRGCVALTFDDAYLGVAYQAAALLRELDLPATVFVATRQAETGDRYWWDRVERSRLAGNDEHWRSRLSDLGLPVMPASREGAGEIVRERVLTRFQGRDPWSGEAGPDDPWRSMTFPELQTLAADDRFDFGVHTLTHPNLPALAAAEQEHEIAASWQALRERLPRARPVIAYPYGLYDSVTIAAARRAGMTAGVTMEGRATGSHPDPFTIPRLGVGERHGSRSISLRMNDACRPLIVLRNRGAHPKVPRAESARTDGER